MGVKNGAADSTFSTAPRSGARLIKTGKLLLKPDWHPVAPYMVMSQADGWGLVSNFEQLFFVTVTALLLAPNTFIAHFTPLPIQSQPRTHPPPPPPRCHPLISPPQRLPGPCCHPRPRFSGSTPGPGLRVEPGFGVHLTDVGGRG